VSSDLIDISIPLREGMTTWPDSVGLTLTRTKRMEDGDVVNNSRLDFDVHMGTHIDAPWHFLAAGEKIEDLALADLIGPAVVAHLPDCDAIGEAELEALALPAGTQRLLLKTRNSTWWAGGTTPFREDFVALTAGGARWIVERGMRLVGIDYLSVQRFRDPPLTHHLLLGARIVIVEGLHLADVEPGEYELICLPILLHGAEGAPARAVLRRNS
jgi:arylformamidase